LEKCSKTLVHAFGWALLEKCSKTLGRAFGWALLEKCSKTLGRAFGSNFRVCFFGMLLDVTLMVNKNHQQ
jgi:hypothetical protein